MKVKLEKFTLKNTDHLVIRQDHGVSVVSDEEIRNKSPVSSRNVMYCFCVSTQCLLFLGIQSSDKAF